MISTSKCFAHFTTSLYPLRTSTGSVPLFLSPQSNDFCPTPSHTSFLCLKYDAINLTNMIYGIRVEALGISVCLPPGLKDEGKIWKLTRSQWDSEVPLVGEEMKKTPSVSYLLLSILISRFLPCEEASQARQQPSLSGITAPSQPSRWHQWRLLCCQRGACFAKT